MAIVVNLQNVMSKRKIGLLELSKQVGITPANYNCAVKIRGYISSKYNKSVTEEEMAFLTIHLRRVSRA